MSKKRIAISTDDKLHISDHLGNTRYVAIYEVEGNDVVGETIVQNTFTHVHNSHEDEEDSHTKFVKALEDCDVLITRGIGPGLENAFQAAGVDVQVVLDRGRLMPILFAYLQGQLHPNPERICNCPTIEGKTE